MGGEKEIIIFISEVYLGILGYTYVKKNKISSHGDQ